MKKDYEVKNHRLKYKRYYEIEFDENYVIHHIDGNRKNNDISNLLLLPKDLHIRYHYFLQKISQSNKPVSEISLNTQLNKPIFFYKDIIEFLNVFEECQKWLLKKDILDWEINHKKELEYGSL